MTIKVENLRKDFKVRRKKENGGFFGATETTVLAAVDGISFDVGAGERVAFIGPNGAGKSTTLKMLSGIMHPTSGHADVAGFVPWKARRKLAYEIGLVFGQRSQLWYHLPVRLSYDLLAKIYGISDADYRDQLARLEKTFSLGPLLEQTVKSLSLGQRMRCEIAASLLHRPKILFLDEPTIGLDVTTKAELRDHLRALGETGGTTIVLTSHDTDDIEKICDRVVLINHGKKLIDTTLDDMRRKYLRQKLLVFSTAEETPRFDLAGAVSLTAGQHRMTVEIDPAITPVPAVMAKALQDMNVHDVTVSDVPLEEVIKHIYKGAA